MRAPSYVILLLFLMVFVSIIQAPAVSAQSQPIVTLADPQTIYSLQEHYEYLIDPTSSLDIQQVSSPEYAKEFLPGGAGRPNFGYTHNTIWVRFRLRNEASASSEWLLEQSDGRIGWIDFYRPTPEGSGYTEVQTGAYRAYSSREIPHLRFIFRLLLAPGSEATYYVRFRTFNSMTFDFSVLSAAQLAVRDRSLYLGLGIFYGILLIMAVYNLLLFMVLRDPAYLFFMIFIVAHGFVQANMDGIDATLPWPASFKWFRGIFWVTISMTACVMLTRAFLSTKTHFPIWNSFLVWFIVILIGPMLVVSLIMRSTSPNSLLTMIVAILLVAVSLRAWQRRYQGAVFFLIGWIIFLASVVVYMLANLNLFGGHTFFTSNVMLPFSASLLMVMLSIAVATRINLLRLDAEHTNRELAISKQRTSQFLDAVPVGVMVQAKDQGVHFMNQIARKITKVKEEILADESAPSLSFNQLTAFHHVVYAGTQEPFPFEALPPTIALSGQTAEAENLEIQSDEQSIPLEIKSTPIVGPDKQVEYVITTLQDITRRVSTETALRESESRLAGILENAADAIISFDREQNVILFNKSAERVFGYTSEEIIGKSLDILIPERYRAALHARSQSIGKLSDLAWSIGERNETIGLRKNGEEFPAEATISKLDTDGLSIYTVFLQDVTDRKQRESELWESQSRFQNLYDHSPVGIIIANLRGEIIQSNEAFQKLTGFEENEIPRKNIADLVWMPDSDEFQARLRSLIAEEVQSFDLEIRFQRKDGQLVWSQPVVSLLRNSKGQATFLFALLRDITERKQSEEELQRYHEHLEDLVSERTSALTKSKERLSILNVATRIINSSTLDSDEVFTAIHTATAWLMPADIFAILLRGEKETEYQIPYFADRNGRRPPECRPIAGSFFEQMMLRKETLWINQRHPELLALDDSIDPCEIHSGLAILLHDSQGIIGVLTIQSCLPNAYSDEDREILESLSTHVAIALENAYLYRKAQDLAVSNERQRLARELHDSVVQLLYSMTLLSGGWRKMAEDGRLSNPDQSFRQLEGIGLQALKEMRLLIHQLRPPILDEVGLVGALQQRLDIVEHRINIETRLLVDGELPRLSNRLEEQLYAIAQEALNNALRHAHAPAVTVYIKSTPGHFHVSIIDNGCGFDSTTVSNGIGLKSMKERAEAVGASLEITSQPEQGTTVAIDIAI